MKVISLVITLIILSSGSLYAAKPCTSLGGLLKVSNYEECMKDPANATVAGKNKNSLSKINEKKKNFDKNNKTLVDMFKNTKK
tara:strand:+ start:582 stop:830 length:249 start_codon:yes stop_codon:yes gene_type:complete